MLLEVATAAQDYISSPSVFADQLTAAGISAWAIQLMKKSNWKIFRWIDDNSVMVTRGVSAFVAIATTAGFQWTWKGSFSAGGDLYLHIPVASVWLSFLWRSSGSFVMQQLIYQGVIKHEAGQTAADVVADKVIENKEVLADAVVEEAKQDPNAMLKLKDNVRVKEILQENRSEPPLDNRPINWDWFKKK